MTYGKRVSKWLVKGLCSAAATIASVELAFFGVWAYTNVAPEDKWELIELLVIIPLLLSFLSLVPTTFFATSPYDNEMLRCERKLPRSMRDARTSFLLGALLAGFSVIIVVLLDWK
jgi:hypothetical protein